MPSRDETSKSDAAHSALKLRSDEGLKVTDLRGVVAGPFNLTLGAGRIAVVQGASGSGKSLFLRMIADLDPNEGEIELNGHPRSSMTSFRWRGMAPYVAADSGWWSERVADHFAASDAGAARELAARLGVTDRPFDGMVTQLSTGERQRLALVRAFVLNPQLILLDEPTGPLDPESVRKFETLLIEKVKDGMSAIMVSHDHGQGARLGAIQFEMIDRKLSLLS